MSIGDKIFQFTFIISILLFIFIVSIMIKEIQFITYSKKKFIINIFKIIFFIEINILNIIFSFFPLKINIFIIIQILLSIFMFFLFLKDWLYNKEISKKYKIALQKKCMVNTRIDDIFKIKKTKSKYEDFSNDETKKVKSIIYEDIKSFEYKIRNDIYILIPLNELTINEYSYFNEWLNLHLRDIYNETNLFSIIIPIFKDESLYDHSNEIIYINETPFLTWWKNSLKLKIFFKISKITGKILFFTIIFLYIINVFLSNYNIDNIISDFFNNLSNWFQE